MPPPLAGLRALDLTGPLGWLCGRVLVDLGVEVVKLEPPGGDPARPLAPRWRAPDGREHGLFWYATNAGKLGATLALDHPGAADALARLADGAHFILDSFPPDSEAARLVAAVAATRPAIVHTTITPFGDRPPGRALHGDDIVIAAMGGPMYLCGDEDRPPVRLPLWQTFCHAGAEAAAGTMLAHLARARTGRGQHVVVDAQAAMVWTLMNAQAFPVFHGDYPRRSGPYVGSRAVRRRMIFACSDGHVSLLLMGGQGSPSTRALMGWMDEHGMLPDWLRAWPWERWEPGWAMEASPEAQAQLVRIEEVVAAFLATRTKAEIYREGIRRRILMAPVATVADIAADAQLAFRAYFQPVDDPSLGRAVRFPGPFARLSGTPLAPPRRPPEPGEHDATVYGDESRGSRARASSGGVHPISPLADLKILDFSWVGVGPITTKYLADHGATVIRVESHARLDVVRLGPPWHDAKPGIERTQFYASYNTSKSGIALDLAKPEARDIARRLAKWADVAVESFTPHVMRGWGLAYEDLRALNPRLVMMSTCLQGQTGPHADFPGYGQLMAALSGFYAISGWCDRDPAPPYGAYTDFIVPRLAVSALLAAIDHQRRTGEGQYLDVSQFEASLHFLAPALLAYDLDGTVAGRGGNRADHAAPHGAYPCAGDDRWIAISVRGDAEWRAFCGVVGLPDDVRFATHAARVAAAEDIDAFVGSATRSRDARELMDRLQAAGIAAGVVQSCLDLHADPVLEGWGFFQWLEHPARPPAPYEGHALRLEDTPGRLRWAAPTLGEHTAVVLRDILGMDDAEIARLVEQKVAW